MIKEQLNSVVKDVCDFCKEAIREDDMVVQVIVGVNKTIPDDLPGENPDPPEHGVVTGIVIDLHRGCFMDVDIRNVITIEQA